MDEPLNWLSGQVVDAAFRIHVRLGSGLLESVYEMVLAYELEKRGLSVARQVPIEIRYDDLFIKEAFRADLIVEDALIIELKSVETLLPVHSKQLLTYLKLTNKKLGLLLNFGAPVFKDGIVRLVNGL
ncbi:GxxExxY protein [Geothermobacter ehrlichii]|uniref:GxxExxY protein n=1 Tax=Geothermobacter ehrlichii TaxID=213224 RepID=A0A5D3WP70_9BACT|nr:GxxExxY protein [Geothermobacter ehrlichii]TYO99208.1 GxxExxY protein [Geothermobacter ehrlichii]